MITPALALSSNLVLSNRTLFVSRIASIVPVSSQVDTSCVRTRAPIPIISLLDVPVVGEPLTLSAIDSVDLDGRIVRYQWSVGTEQGAAATLTITPSAVGPLQVHLLVVDDFGLGANATLELDVRDSPPPTAKSSQRVLDASLFGPGLGLLLLLCALLGALGIALSLELLRRRTIENSPPRQRHL